VKDQLLERRVGLVEMAADGRAIRPVDPVEALARGPPEPQLDRRETDAERPGDRSL